MFSVGHDLDDQRELVQLPGEEGVLLGGEPEEFVQVDERAFRFGNIAVFLQVLLERGISRQILLEVEEDLEVVAPSHFIEVSDIDLRSGNDAETFQVRGKRRTLRFNRRTLHTMVKAGRVEKCTRCEHLPGQNLIPDRPQMGVRWPMAGRDPPVPGRETEGLEREERLHRYLSMLGSGDLNERWRAADALGELGDSRAVQPLIEALEDGYVDVRWKAAKALGLIDGREPVLPLIRSLEDDSPWVRMGAAWALGKIGDPRAVEPLIRLLDDTKPRVRRMAAWALGRIGNPRAREPLLRLLGDADRDVRVAGRQALDEIGTEREIPSV